jgi:hypothetical protein
MKKRRDRLPLGSTKRSNDSIKCRIMGWPGRMETDEEGWMEGVVTAHRLVGRVRKHHEAADNVSVSRGGLPSEEAPPKRQALVTPLGSSLDSFYASSSSSSSSDDTPMEVGSPSCEESGGPNIPTADQVLVQVGARVDRFVSTVRVCMRTVLLVCKDRSLQSIRSPFFLSF